MRWLLLLLGLVGASACPSKTETWKVLSQYNHLGRDAIIRLCREHMTWYEKMVYRPEWIADQLEAQCGLPLTEANVLGKDDCLPCPQRALLGRLT